MSRKSAAVVASPEGLSERAGALWLAVKAEYELSPAEVELLTEACRSLDRADEARAVVDREGCTVVDRYNSPKSHPAVDVENRARAFFASAVARLGVQERR